MPDGESMAPRFRPQVSHGFDGIDPARLSRGLGVQLAEATATDPETRRLVEMIELWATLEGVAARRAAERASDREIATLARLFTPFQKSGPEADLAAYSAANLRFHRALFRLARNRMIERLAGAVAASVRAMRVASIGEADRARRSIVDHLDIIAALAARDGARAELLARRHTMELAAHVESRHARLN
jgi:DNA-binding GntR family transcriptional regulator